MAATDITKPASTPPPAARTTDIFGAMRDEMDRVFERFERGIPRLPALFSRNGNDWLMPEFDVHDNGRQITIEADLPGVAEKDVSVTLTGGLLTVKGEKKSHHEETKENCYLAERSYGAFERTLRLPETIDEAKLEARFENGVLKIVAQKKPEAVKAERKIEIKKG
jgi:HSP20 family protein